MKRLILVSSTVASLLLLNGCLDRPVKPRSSQDVSAKTPDESIPSQSPSPEPSQSPSTSPSTSPSPTESSPAPAPAPTSRSTSRPSPVPTPSDTGRVATLPEWCDQERILTVLATNDIHGAIEPGTTRTGQKLGGLSFFHGVTHAIKAGLKAKYTDECSGVLILDGGDQFQGTLLSNYSEGQLMFDLMGEIGYDAIVPGNHDYDFGPLGWLHDQVEPGRTSSNPREVIEKLAASAKFPLISANTYLKASLKDISGRRVEIGSSGCTSSQVLDWSGAQRPAFLKPYRIQEVAGMRIAMIGLDHPDTHRMTTSANVSDLCFRDPVIEYLSLRRELKNQADVFIIVTHQGDANGNLHLSQMIGKILATDPEAVDAVVAGHTHQINHLNIGGVPAIQSGANGERFGRIDLVIDVAKKKVNRNKTKSLAGALLLHHECDPKAAEFCDVTGINHTDLTYEQQKVKLSASIDEKVTEAKKQIASMADRVLGVADRRITRERILESALGNALADGLREAAQAPIALINTGGIRTNIEPGKVTYAQLYEVLPFNNHAVVIGPMKTGALIRLLIRSMQTCGDYGALVVSGLRVTYSRDCTKPENGVDPEAKLLTVTLESTGDMLYDGRGEIPVILEREFEVVTLDFLSTGGSGYDAFKGHPVRRNLGIFREVLAEALAQSPDRRWKAQVDGRWKNVRNPRVSGSEN